LSALVLLLPTATFAELAISGVGDELERNVRAYVALAEEPCDAESWRIRRRYRAMEKEAIKALEPFGYYQAKLSSTLTMDEDCWHATLDIERGEPVRLREVDIDILGDAAADPVFQPLLAPSQLVSGSRLNHADYEGYKRSLQTTAAERGYFNASFPESRIDIWPDQGAADISVAFDSGSRYRVSEIRQEQDFLEPQLVAGYLDLEPGSLFDSNELARAHRDLSDSGYFGRVEVVPDVNAAANGEVPVRVAVEPGIRTEYTVGAGFSTDTGAHVRGGFRNNRVNPRGHRIRADVGYSPVVEGITGEYRVPLADPRAEWLSYTGAISSEDTDTFDSDSARLGLRLSKRLSKTWIRTYSVDVDYEKFSVGEESDSSLLVLPGVAFDHKHADRDVYPDRGRRVVLELSGASATLGSTTSFLQVTAWSRWIRAVGNGRFIARGSVGFTRKSDFEQLPPSVRFFAGGDQSIRGFDYESLGPTDEEGNVIGGSNLLLASIEYEHRLRGQIYGALFVDAGNAFDDFDVEAEVGAGFGIKWRSPIGPIRAYIGYPVSDSDRNPRLHLRLGPDL
jgi:translocation and assembly module TamA